MEDTEIVGDKSPESIAREYAVLPGFDVIGNAL